MLRQWALYILIALFIFGIAPLIWANGRDVITVEVKKNASLIEIIEENGYTLNDEDLDVFLGEFILLNEDVKNIGLIPKGSAVKLPLTYLKEKKRRRD